MEREKAAKLAADATHLGFNKIPKAAAEVLHCAPAPAGGDPRQAAALGEATAAGQGQAERQPKQQEQQQQQQQQLGGTSSLEAHGHSPPPAATAEAGSAKPLFCDLLRTSMLAVSETRAWFNEARGYAMVRQSRLPTALPQVGA